MDPDKYIVNILSSIMSKKINTKICYIRKELKVSCVLLKIKCFGSKVNSYEMVQNGKVSNLRLFLTLRPYGDCKIFRNLFHKSRM